MVLTRGGIACLAVLVVATTGWGEERDQDLLGEPQSSGWPLTAAEREFVLKPEFERRPGRVLNRHLPEMWPVLPSAGHWGGTAWLDTHARLVDYVRAHAGPCDVLLVGDSITQQWGSPLDKAPLNEAWQKRFGRYRTLNIGIGGDKSQNVLWRLDHGAVEGLDPRVIVLMIGNNNMFFTPETGTQAAARGIQACVDNLRGKFPRAGIVVVKILPAHQPGDRFYEDLCRTNRQLDDLKLSKSEGVHVLDLWGDFTNDDGSLKAELFTPDRIHLSPAGYEVYASRLQKPLERLLAVEIER